MVLPCWIIFFLNIQRLGCLFPSEARTVLMHAMILILFSFMMFGFVLCDTSLFSYYKNHDEFVSNKWEHFIAVYEEIFIKYRDKEGFRLLEIGVQNGGSLQIWSSYFGPGSEIVIFSLNLLSILSL